MTRRFISWWGKIHRLKWKKNPGLFWKKTLHEPGHCHCDFEIAFPIILLHEWNMSEFSVGYSWIIHRINWPSVANIAYIFFWVQTLEGCSIKLHAGTKIKSSWVKSAESSLQFVSIKAFPQKLNVLKKDLYDKNNASHDLKRPVSPDIPFMSLRLIHRVVPWHISDCRGSRTGSVPHSPRWKPRFRYPVVELVGHSRHVNRAGSSCGPFFGKPSSMTTNIITSKGCFAFFLKAWNHSKRGPIFEKKHRFRLLTAHSIHVWYIFLHSPFINQPNVSSQRLDDRSFCRFLEVNQGGPRLSATLLAKNNPDISTLTLPRWLFLIFCIFFAPKSGEMIQFDVAQIFRWVGEKPPTRVETGCASI